MRILQNDQKFTNRSLFPKQLLIPDMSWYTSPECTRDGARLQGIKRLSDYASRALLDDRVCVVIFDHPDLDRYMEMLWNFGIGTPMVIAVEYDGDSIFDAILSDEDAKKTIATFDGTVSAFVSSPLTRRKFMEIGIPQERWHLLGEELMKFDDKLNLRKAFPGFYAKYQVVSGTDLVRHTTTAFLESGNTNSVFVRRPDLDGGIGAVSVTKETLYTNAFQKFLDDYASSGMEILVEQKVPIKYEFSVHIRPDTLECFVTLQIIKDGQHRGNTISYKKGYPQGWPKGLSRHIGVIQSFAQRMKNTHAFPKGFTISFDCAETQNGEMVIFEANMRDTASTPLRGACLRLTKVGTSYMVTLPTEMSYDELSTHLAVRGLAYGGERGIIIGAPYCLPEKCMLIAFAENREESENLMRVALTGFGIKPCF